jgi:hypothetical protein
MFSLLLTARLFGDSRIAVSAKKEMDVSRSLHAAAMLQAAEAARIEVSS